MSALNVPLCLGVLALGWRSVPESRSRQPGRLDLAGAVLAVVGLGAFTVALTDATSGRPGVVAATTAVAVVALVAFLLVEHRRRDPLLPLGLFRSRVFSAANAMTFLVYGALGVVFFVLVLQLQVSAGWSALAAGLTSIPLTIALMLLSPWAGGLASRIGPRVPMTVGPLVCALGLLLLGVGEGTRWYDVLVGLVVFALGMALLVSPLTTAVLAAVPEEHAGIASGINNAVARAGSLLAVAALPIVAGLSGDAYLDPGSMTSGYRASMTACAGLMAAGGVTSWLGLGPRDDAAVTKSGADGVAPRPEPVSASGRPGAGLRTSLER